MAIFDFWKRRRLNKVILNLKEHFNEEIKDFRHFKELQSKKIDIIIKIKNIWNKEWAEAEKFVKEALPSLIRRQLIFIEADIEYIDQEDFILNYLGQIEQRKNTILGYHITQIVNQEHLEAIRNQNRISTNKIKEVISENSEILKQEHIIKLKENLHGQLSFFKEKDSWSAINQNEEFLEDLNKERALTQKTGYVMGAIMAQIGQIIEVELNQHAGGYGIIRRKFLGYAGAGFISAFLLSNCTLKVVELSERDVTGKYSEKEDIKTNIRIFYGVHDTAESALKFRDELQKADIYIPEKFGWYKDTLDFYRDLCSGNVTPEEFFAEPNKNKGSFTMQQLEMLYKSGKYITFIDVPEEHIIYKFSKNLEYPAIDYNNSFEDALLLFKDYYNDDAIMIKEREDFMFNQLRNFIKKLKEDIKKNPEFFPNIKNKHKINILLTLGAIHTQLSHNIHKGFYEVASRKFQTTPFIMPIGFEITRRNIFGKKVSDELLAANLIEGMLFPILFNEVIKISRDWHKSFLFLRMVVAKFSFEEIKNMYKSIQSNRTKKAVIITNALSRKGIKIPQTPEEFMNMLPRYVKS